jgi:hypothetical protein
MFDEKNTGAFASQSRRTSTTIHAAGTQRGPTGKSSFLSNSSSGSVICNTARTRSRRIQNAIEKTTKDEEKRCQWSEETNEWNNQAQKVQFFGEINGCEIHK